MLDFQSIKQSFPIQDAISLLGLTVKQYNGSYRGRCPGCNGGNDRSLVITPDKKSYYCFVAQRGGDVIALVSHILKIGMREAAQKIADSTSTIPQEPEGKAKATPKPIEGDTPMVPAGAHGDEGTYARLAPLTYILYEHEAIQKMGFSPDMAEDFGIGYANKGMMRGKVCIPVYHCGSLVGYIGMEPDAQTKVPSNLKAH